MIFFENFSTFVEVIGKNQVSCFFFDSRCIFASPTYSTAARIMKNQSLFYDQNLSDLIHYYYKEISSP